MAATLRYGNEVTPANATFPQTVHHLHFYRGSLREPAYYILTPLLGQETGERKRVAVAEPWKGLSHSRKRESRSTLTTAGRQPEGHFAPLISVISSQGGRQTKHLTS